MSAIGGGQQQQKLDTVSKEKNDNEKHWGICQSW
jgi:hypothetical protein